MSSSGTMRRKDEQKSGEVLDMGFNIRITLVCNFLYEVLLMRKIIVALVLVLFLVGCAPASTVDEYGNEVDRPESYEKIEVRSDILISKIKGYQDWSVRRFIDEEYGIICYRDSVGMSCLYLQEEK